MKKIGELMTDLGFRENASQGTKEAFIKHLIRAAEDVYVTTPSEKSEIEKNQLTQIAESLVKPNDEKKSSVGEVQLSFNFNDVG